MLPNSTENILQDTKNVPDTPVPRQTNTRRLIAILIVILVIGFTIRAFAFKQTPSAPGISQSVATTASPAPFTDTFVDTIFGTLVFYRHGSLVSLDLPTRSEHIIVGVGANSEVKLDDSFAPVWSPDGTKLAVVTGDHKIVVTQFDTGAFVGSFPLPASASQKNARISIDPASEVLAIASTSESGSDQSVRFFSLLTQKELGVYPKCSGNGAWMTGIGFAMSCDVADTHSIVLIRFEPNSSVMTPLLRETSQAKYQIIDEYKPGILLVLRSRGTQKDLITLAGNGALTTIPPTQYKSVIDVEKIANAQSALMTRIQTTLQTHTVDDVTIASDNSFVVYQTDEGLFAVKLDLKDTPYRLSDGTLARLRPLP